MVPLAPRRHACSTPRTRRRSTRTSTRSTSRARTGAALWDELKGVFDHWIGAGRADLPRRQPAHQVVRVLGVGDRRDQARAPGRDLPAEAFTRPKVMHRLAKLGFTQSYTYFTWRNTKHELTEYFTELSQGPGREYFRPNAWPNTPDILHEQLHGGRRAGVHGAAGAGGDARGQLRHLRPGLRAAREHAARAGQRGVPRFREVPAAPLGPRARPTACAPSSRA